NDYEMEKRFTMERRKTKNTGMEKQFTMERRKTKKKGLPSIPEKGPLPSLEVRGLFHEQLNASLIRIQDEVDSRDTPEESRGPKLLQERLLDIQRISNTIGTEDKPCIKHLAYLLNQHL
ncbi:unnamed protein product, partial [Meganyctiphanes norvegica]